MAAPAGHAQFRPAPSPQPPRVCEGPRPGGTVDRWATDRETGQGPWPGSSARRRPGPSGNGSMEEVAPQSQWSGQPASLSLLTPAPCHVPAGRGGGTGEGGVTLTYTGLPAF